MDVRPYLPANRDACLAVFDSNTPDFFKSHERRHFEEFLEGPNCSYFVMDQDGAIAGCGGYFITEDKALASSSNLGHGAPRLAPARPGPIPTSVSAARD